ncbi:YesL family protein [Aquibacillus salsiterrae]|uniref:YesL family protein n=1 Tax=Aquibacillus salsiterrae TaxID=2950439 RepID=A0A9X4AEH4_9BACI|nr:YesL family protein [Aquibacillus salsiterrae]MDC3416902.1 YesL family protein [Aquibacillus salsiterrae]
MDNGKQFGEGILSVISNNIYWLALINVYFVACNILFLFFFLTLIPSFSNTVIYFLALIPTGPAVAALFYTLGKLIREKEVSPTKDFFYGYRLNFRDSLKVWLPMLLVIFILVVDIQYFNVEPTTRNQVLAGIFLVVLILLATILNYVFLISANFKFRVRDIYRLSMYYSFTRIKITTGNIGIIVMTLFFMFIISDFMILFVASVVGYFLVLNSRAILEDIKENFVKQENKPDEDQDK